MIPPLLAQADLASPTSAATASVDNTSAVAAAAVILFAVAQKGGIGVIRIVITAAFSAIL